MQVESSPPSLTGGSAPTSRRASMLCLNGMQQPTDGVSSVKATFDHLTGHRPPTPLGDTDTDAGVALRHLSPARRRLSRFVPPSAEDIEHHMAGLGLASSSQDGMPFARGSFGASLGLASASQDGMSFTRGSVGAGGGGGGARLMGHSSSGLLPRSGPSSISGMPGPYEDPPPLSQRTLISLAMRSHDQPSSSASDAVMRQGSVTMAGGSPSSSLSRVRSLFSSLQAERQPGVPAAGVPHISECAGVARHRSQLALMPDQYGPAVAAAAAGDDSLTAFMAGVSRQQYKQQDSKRSVPSSMA